MYELAEQTGIRGAARRREPPRNVAARAPVTFPGGPRLGLSCFVWDVPAVNTGRRHNWENETVLVHGTGDLGVIFPATTSLGSNVATGRGHASEAGERGTGTARIGGGTQRLRPAHRRARSPRPASASPSPPALRGRRPATPPVAAPAGSAGAPWAGGGVFSRQPRRHPRHAIEGRETLPMGRAVGRRAPDERQR